MKRFGFRFCVALLTFSMGIIIAAVYLRVSQYLSTPSVSAPALRQSYRPAPSSGRVEVKFRRFVPSGVIAPYTDAEFLIVNGSSEPLYYEGYSKNDTCSYKIQWRTRVFNGMGCDCGTGLERRELLPGEQVPITVLLAGQRYQQLIVTRGKGTFQVGFDFLTGESKREQTVWSDEVTVPEQ